MRYQIDRAAMASEMSATRVGAIQPEAGRFPGGCRGEEGVGGGAVLDGPNGLAR